MGNRNTNTNTTETAYTVVSTVEKELPEIRHWVKIQDLQELLLKAMKIFSQEEKSQSRRLLLCIPSESNFWMECCTQYANIEYEEPDLEKGELEEHYCQGNDTMPLIVYLNAVYSWTAIKRYPIIGEVSRRTINHLPKCKVSLNKIQFEIYQQVQAQVAQKEKEQCNKAE